MGRHYSQLMSKTRPTRRVKTSRLGSHAVFMVAPKLWRLERLYPYRLDLDFVEASHTHRGTHGGAKKVWLMPGPDQQTASTLDLAVKRTVRLAYLYAAVGRAFYLGTTA